MAWESMGMNGIGERGDGRGRRRDGMSCTRMTADLHALDPLTNTVTMETTMGQLHVEKRKEREGKEREREGGREKRESKINRRTLDSLYALPDAAL